MCSVHGQVCCALRRVRMSHHGRWRKGYIQGPLQDDGKVQGPLPVLVPRFLRKCPGDHGARDPQLSSNRPASRAQSRLARLRSTRPHRRSSTDHVLPTERCKRSRPSKLEEQARRHMRVAVGRAHLRNIVGASQFGEICECNTFGSSRNVS